MNKKWWSITALIFMLGLLLGASNLGAQIVMSQAIPSDGTPNANDTITVAINIDMTGMTAPDTALGSFTATLDWNPAILSFVSHSGILQGFVGVVNTNNVGSGNLIFNGAKPTGSSGSFDIITMTFAVVGFPGQSTVLDLEYSAMAAAYTFNNLLPFLFIGDGLVTIAGAANSPPDLDSIPDQGMLEGDTLDVPLVATDPNGHAISLTANNLPLFGSLTDNGDGTGTIRFTPGFNDAALYLNIEVIATDNGGPPLSDTSYFALDVTDSNRAPIAIDDTVSTLEDSSVSVDPLSNDSDPDNNLLTIVSVSQPANGSASINTGDTTITYDPDPNYFGSDNFIYRISDGITVDSAVIHVTITSVNDTPTITGLPDSVTFDANSSTTLDIFAAVDDIETPDSLLTYNFIDTPDTLILLFNVINGMLTISAKDTQHAVNAELYIGAEDPQGASVFDTVAIVVNSVVGINDPFENQIPQRYMLSQNYPNPFNPTTTIRYGLPVAGKVKIEIFNMLGQRISTIVDEQKPAGYHSANLDAAGLSSGIYFYRIQATGFTQVRKMVLMR